MKKVSVFLGAWAIWKQSFLFFFFLLIHSAATFCLKATLSQEHSLGPSLFGLVGVRRDMIRVVHLHLLPAHLLRRGRHGLRRVRHHAFDRDGWRHRSVLGNVGPLHRRRGSCSSHVTSCSAQGQVVHLLRQRAHHAGWLHGHRVVHGWRDHCTCRLHNILLMRHP